MLELTSTEVKETRFVGLTNSIYPKAFAMKIDRAYIGVMKGSKPVLGSIRLDGSVNWMYSIDNLNSDHYFAIIKYFPAFDMTIALLDNWPRS